MTEVHDDHLPLSAGGSAKHPPEQGDCECFEPLLQEAVRHGQLAPKPRQSSLPRLVDETYRKLGILLPTSTGAPNETGLPAPEAVATSDAEMAMPSEPPPPPRVATAPELVHWMKRVLLAQTHLSNDAAELVAFWVISTWHQEALAVRPCLVITGPAHHAIRVLHVLEKFCPKAALLADFRRGDLGQLSCCRTILISEPNLNKRTANLLSGLTDSSFFAVAGPSLAPRSKSTAIYAGENPETHPIQNSIHIHLTPTSAEPAISPLWLQKMVELERVPIHLQQYREKNARHVLQSTWSPSGLSAETASVATELGRCLVDAPELLLKLVALLKTRDKQHLSELSNTAEGVILEATLNLCHEGKSQFLVREIATEANRIAKERGERLSYSAETVGHRLKKVGLSTRRLGKAGRGLVMDLPTIARIHELAKGYGGAGLEQAETNLNCPFCTENK